MEQFEVRRLRLLRPPRDLAVLVQSDFVDVFETVVVAPLIPRVELPALRRLRPALTVAGRDYVVAVDRLAAIDRTVIGDVVGSVEFLRDDLLRALDLLFTGF